MAKRSPVTQAELVTAVHENLGGTLSKAEVKTVVEGLKTVVTGELAGGYPVNLLGLVKLEYKYALAKPKRKGINPFTQEPAVFAAKPESLALKARVLAGAKSVIPSTKKAVGKELISELKS